MNPILLDIPTPIETERLLIREPRPGDGAKLNAAVRASFDNLNQWMPWATNPDVTVAESEENIRRAHAKWILREDLRLQLFDKRSGEFVGSSGLHRIKWDIPSFEIGYWVNTQYQGKGFITEAASAIALFAFEALGAKRVEIRCDPENMKSRKIPERLGFALEGILRQDSMDARRSALRDTCVFARLDAKGLPNVGAKWSGAGQQRTAP